MLRFRVEGDCAIERHRHETVKGLQLATNAVVRVHPFVYVPHVVGEGELKEDQARLVLWFADSSFLEATKPRPVQDPLRGEVRAKGLLEASCRSTLPV